MFQIYIFWTFQKRFNSMGVYCHRKFPSSSHFHHTHLLNGFCHTSFQIYSTHTFHFDIQQTFFSSENNISPQGRTRYDLLLSWSVIFFNEFHGSYGVYYTRAKAGAALQTPCWLIWLAQWVIFFLSCLYSAVRSKW